MTTPAQDAAEHAKTPAQKRMAARMLTLEASGNRLGFWSSGTKKVCNPVILRRQVDGFTYVTGLTGRFKDRDFSIVSSEFTTYIRMRCRLGV